MGMAIGADSTHGSSRRCPWGQAQLEDALLTVLLGAADQSVLFAFCVCGGAMFELTPYGEGVRGQNRSMKLR